MGEREGVGPCAALARELGRHLGAPRAFVVCREAADVLGELAERAGTTPVAALDLASPVSCVDLRALGARARSAGEALIVNNAMSSWAGCPAVRLGAHVSVEPLAPSAALVGVSKDVERVLPGVGAWLEGCDEPAAETLDLIVGETAAREAAWHAASDVAQVVASYLVCHPRVAEVRYPGLKTDPSFEVAAHTLTGGFGPVVDWRCEGEDGAWERIVCAPGDPHALVMDLEQRLLPDQEKAADRKGHPFG